MTILMAFAVTAALVEVSLLRELQNPLNQSHLPNLKTKASAWYLPTCELVVRLYDLDTALPASVSKALPCYVVLMEVYASYASP